MICLSACCFLRLVIEIFQSDLDIDVCKLAWMSPDKAWETIAVVPTRACRCTWSYVSFTLLKASTDE